MTKRDFKREIVSFIMDKITDVTDDWYVDSSENKKLIEANLDDGKITININS